MTIVSLSFPEELVKEIDQIQGSHGFAGRSEMVRAAIRLLIEDSREKDSMKGKISALLVVTHEQADEAPITSLKHRFESIVKMHIHNKMNTGKCLEVFVVEGEGSRVASMTKSLQKEDTMRSVRLVII